MDDPIFFYFMSLIELELMFQFGFAITGRKNFNNQVWGSDTASVIQLFGIANHTNIRLYYVVDFVELNLR